MRKKNLIMMAMLFAMSILSVGCQSGMPATSGSSATEMMTPPAVTQPRETTLTPETTELVTTVPVVTLDSSVYYITEPFIYPPFDPSSPEGYLEKCQVPEETLAHMTTEALLKTVLTYPKLADFMASSNTDTIAVISDRLNSMNELVQREDLGYMLSVFRVEDLEVEWIHAAQWVYNKLIYSML